MDPTLSNGAVAVVRADFTKVSGSADGIIRHPQIAALLAAQLGREPTAAEIDRVVNIFGGELTLARWTKWLKGKPFSTQTLSSITGSTSRSVHKSWNMLADKETRLAPSKFAAVDTGKTGKISVEEWTARFGSANGFEQYDTNHDGEIDQAEFLKAMTTMALAGIVNSAMGEGWSQIEINDISVKDTSGHGGASLYRVSAPGATPEAVALKALSKDDARVEGRIEAATMLFSDHGIGPKRLAQGDDWTIEPWEGLGEPELDSVEKFEMYGRLYAQIHQLPTEWYDEWREDLCTRQPWMKGMPLGSWVRIIADYWADQNALPEILARSCHALVWSPVTEAGSRIVTIHDDMHKRNMLQMADCMRAIDFDKTCVSYAVNDLGHALVYVSCGWFDTETGFFNLPDEEMLVRKRAFIASYLSGMGDAATPADVDALLLDALLCSAFLDALYCGKSPARVSPLSQEDKETSKMTKLDDKGLTFERIDNKLVVCSSDAELRGLGILPNPPEYGWQYHGATLVPVSEALEINNTDGHITASINGQQVTLIAHNLHLEHGALMGFITPVSEDTVKEKENGLLDVAQCCLDENGRISFCHSSTDFPDSEGLRLCNDEGPGSDAEITQAFMAKLDSLEEYSTRVRGDAAMQERVFLKGGKKAYTEWLDSAQK